MDGTAADSGSGELLVAIEEAYMEVQSQTHIQAKKDTEVYCRGYFGCKGHCGNEAFMPAAAQDGEY